MRSSLLKENHAQNGAVWRDRHIRDTKHTSCGLFPHISHDVLQNLILSGRILMKKLWLAALLTMSPILAMAQTPRCPPPASVPPKSELLHLLMTAQDRGFLWKITKDGHSSWLYGTIHASRQEWMLPGPQIRTAMMKSDLVALELNLQDPATLATLRKPEDPDRMQHLIQSGRKKKLDNLAAELCLPVANFSKTAVGLEAAGLSTAVGRVDGYYPDYAADLVIQGIANGMKKELIPLEDAQTQRDLIISKAQGDEDTFIDGVIKDVSSGEARMDEKRLVEMWGRSDVSQLQHYDVWCKCLRTAKEREQTKRLLDDRNMEMAQKVLSFHEAGKSLFVAVGSLHMAGPKGLPALLKQDGFDIQQIVPATTSPSAL